jgi:hypothetical protein
MAGSRRTCAPTTFSCAYCFDVPSLSVDPFGGATERQLVQKEPKASIRNNKANAAFIILKHLNYHNI